MTDTEKIEKLLEHMVKIEEVFDCNDLFKDNVRFDDDWCEKHCKYTHPQKECFRHWLLGE